MKFKIIHIQFAYSSIVKQVKHKVETNFNMIQYNQITRLTTLNNDRN